MLVIANRLATIRSYATNFPATENPLSEGGRWLNGATDGIDWGDVKTTPGYAGGTIVSASPPYSDPTAILTGVWSPDQQASGRIRTVNQQAGFNQEAEMRLRSSISQHVCNGYEALVRLSTSGWYTDIVRWNGPLNDFDALSHVTIGPGVVDKDLLMALIVGTLIRVYLNGVEINNHDTAVDSAPVSGAGPARYSSGAPGLGLFQHGQTTATLPDFGFTYFAAQDV